MGQPVADWQNGTPQSIQRRTLTFQKGWVGVVVDFFEILRTFSWSTIGHRCSFIFHKSCGLTHFNYLFLTTCNLQMKLQIPDFHLSI